MSTEVDTAPSEITIYVDETTDQATGPDDLDETDIRAAVAADLQRMGLWPEPASDPDPHPADAPTAEVIARYLAGSAWQTWYRDVPRLLREWEAAGLPTTGPLRDAFVHASAAASAQYAAAYLLRQVGDSLTPAELDGVSLPYEGWVQHAIDNLESWMAEWGVDADSRERLLATGQREAAMA